MTFSARFVRFQSNNRIKCALISSGAPLVKRNFAINQYASLLIGFLLSDIFSLSARSPLRVVRSIPAMNFSISFIISGGRVMLALLKRYASVLLVPLNFE